MRREQVTIDGNEAAAYVAFKTNEIIAIYPITPSSPMGEFADGWATSKEKNIWGMTPVVREINPRWRRVAPCTARFKASANYHVHRQPGLALDDAEHVQDRRRAHKHSLSHRGSLESLRTHVYLRGSQRLMTTRHDRLGDVVRQLDPGNKDFALIAQASTLRARVPFLHVFDGFRTSHEVMKIESCQKMTYAD